MTEEEKALFDSTAVFVKKYEAAMEDDFNTADAIAAIFEFVKFANTNASGTCSREYLEALYQRLAVLCDVMGIIVEKETEMLDEDIEALIRERQEARKAKDFKRADEIRDQLQEMGIILKDTREGVTWKRA